MADRHVFFTVVINLNAISNTNYKFMYMRKIIEAKIILINVFTRIGSLYPSLHSQLQSRLTVPLFWQAPPATQPNTNCDVDHMIFITKTIVVIGIVKKLICYATSKKQAPWQLATYPKLVAHAINAHICTHFSTCNSLIRYYSTNNYYWFIWQQDLFFSVWVYSNPTDSPVTRISNTLVV